jgi:hypothetical protein
VRWSFSCPCGGWAAAWVAQTSKRLAVRFSTRCPRQSLGTSKHPKKTFGNPYIPYEQLKILSTRCLRAVQAQSTFQGSQLPSPRQPDLPRHTIPKHGIILISASYLHQHVIRTRIHQWSNRSLHLRWSSGDDFRLSLRKKPSAGGEQCDLCL